MSLDGTVGRHTYRLETTPDSVPYVASTVEKYYDGLLTEMSREPGGEAGVVVCTTTHEVPVDALCRIADVRHVRRV